MATARGVYPSTSNDWTGKSQTCGMETIFGKTLTGFDRV